MQVPEVELRTQFEAALTEDIYGVAWRYAWRLAAGGRGGCREEAEDLLQEALSHAWRQFGQLRERSQFKAWLLSIVRTRHLNRLRTARRRPLVEGEPPAGLHGPAGEDDLLRQQASAALAQLSPAERELLSLFYLEDLSLAETGQALGLDARVVRQRLYRARQNLRRVLERSANGAWRQPQPGAVAPRRTVQ